MPNIATIPGGDYAAYPIPHTGKTTTINSHTGMLARPAFRGKTQITKPNPNADISPDNIATITGAVNPVFTVSAAGGYTANKTVPGEFYSLPNGVADDFDGLTATRRTGKLVLDGTENWIIYENIVYLVKNILPIGTPESSTQKGICTHYQISTGSSTSAVKINQIGWNDAGNMFIGKESAPDISALKAYHAAQKAAGTPVTVYYELATPAATYANYDLSLTDGANTVSCNSAVLQDVTWMEIDSRKIPFADSAIIASAAKPGSKLDPTYVTYIPENADLNDYVIPGKYAATDNNIVATLKNCPAKEAFVLDVSYGTGIEYPKQDLTEYMRHHKFVRTYNPGSGYKRWLDWNEYALTKTYPIQLLNGWNGNVSCKITGKVMIVSGNIKNPANITVDSTMLGFPAMCMYDGFSIANSNGAVIYSIYVRGSGLTLAGGITRYEGNVLMNINIALPI